MARLHLVDPPITVTLAVSSTVKALLNQTPRATRTPSSRVLALRASVSEDASVLHTQAHRHRGDKCFERGAQARPKSRTYATEPSMDSPCTCECTGDAASRIAVSTSGAGSSTSSINTNSGSIAFAAVLILLSGLFSGLNLGLMSLTEDDLRVVIEGSQDHQEVRWAKRILPLRRRGNLLLCTLLLGNTLVNALIAILLDDLSSGGASLGPLSLGAIITTAVIVVFGEIVPQSVCSRHGLYVGARSLPIVYVFVVLCFPIALPISLILDRILGREIGLGFSRQGLLALIRLNVESSHHRGTSSDAITSADAQLLSGALTFKEKKVGDRQTSS